jgi:hypothetical protein
MYQSGQLELRCSALLNTNTAGRPTFEATIRRGWGGQRQYQVFVMPQGLLFLERCDQKETVQLTGNQRTVLALAMFGGAIGGLIGGMIAKPKVNQSDVVPAKRESGLELKSDDELLELARKRRKSFVIKHEEVLSASIDPPSALDSMFGHRTLAGWITIETMSHGRLRLEFRSAAEMAVAAESLPPRYGSRVLVNAELDVRRKRFVSRRHA